MTMTRTVILVLATLVVAATAEAADADKKSEKPLVPCDQIVEVYKRSHSVDETSTTLKVDQSRVAQCVKAAGIDEPQQNNR